MTKGIQRKTEHQLRDDQRVLLYVKSYRFSRISTKNSATYLLNCHRFRLTQKNLPEKAFISEAPNFFRPS
jgi:hypothetical protein